MTSSPDAESRNKYYGSSDHSSRKKWKRFQNMALAALSMATGACAVELKNNTAILPTPPAITLDIDTETPSPTSTEHPLPTTPEPTRNLSPHHEEKIGELKITYNAEGYPISFQTTIGVIPFDMNKMIQAREQALKTKQLTLVDTIRIPDLSTPDPYEKFYQDDLGWKPSKEKPLTQELPKDVLTEKQLSERGITILQTDTTTLYVRQSAFKKGGPLELFDGKFPGKLIIVLVPGNTVGKFYLKDKKYDRIRPYIDNFAPYIPHTYRIQRTKELQQKIGSLQQKIQTEIKSDKQEKDKRVRNELLDLLIELQELNQATDTELDEYLTDTYQPSGLFVLPKFDIIKSKDKEIDRYFRELPSEYHLTDTSIAYLAVGENKFDYSHSYHLYVDESGVFRIIEGKGKPGVLGLAPQRKDTHPNPREFNKALMNPMGYIYSDRNPGFILNHELAHFNLTVANAVKGSTPQYSETSTDEKAAEKQQENYDAWEKSGFTDDSEYPFLFSVKDRYGQGYIVTKKIDDNRS